MVIEYLEDIPKMKRRLSITAIIIMMNQVLTPFSYAFADDVDIFDGGENVIETVDNIQEEDTQSGSELDSQQDAEKTSLDTQNDEGDIEDSQQSGASFGDASEGQEDVQTEDTKDSEELVPQNDENGTGDESSGTEGNENEGSYVGNGTGDTQNNETGTGDVNDEVDYSQYTSETRVAVLANKLGINWEEDAEYYAQLAGITEEYWGTAEQNEQIRLFLLDNLEGILNGEFEEIIEEMKAGTRDVQEGQNGTGDAQAGSGDQISPTPICQEGQDCSEDGNSSLINEGDVYHAGMDEVVEDLTGDILTGDIELLTGEVLLGEVLTGDILSGSAIEAVNEILEEIAAQRAEELAHMWDELNETKITGQDMYKDVIVSVEAPVNSFPAKTELRITPITGDDKMQEIKNQLVENTDVTQESELVSFDISFIYTLSNGEEVELQPYTGQTVKVSFNFTYNDTLSQADSDSDKELKVYHLEEVKDEKGKKTEEVEVKEIEVNKSESSDGELVVDADKFSIYTLAAADGVELRAAADMCTVTFENGHCYYGNTDDGTCTFDMPASIEVECGSSISRQDIDEPYHCTSASSYSNGNYYFSRWATIDNPSYTNTSYNYDFSTAVTEDITLYAIGDRSTNYVKTVTFDANGGLLTSSGSMYYGVYGLVKQPSDPIRTGYMLNCWTTSQTDTSCNNPYNFNSTTNTITSDTNLYAQWTAVSYTIKFNANGGSGSANDIDAGYGVSYSLPNDNFSRDGYVLYSWNTESDGSGTGYDLEDELTNLTTTNGDIITLYAQWGIQNRVTFEGNGGTVSVPYVDVISGQTAEVPEDPTWSQHRFLGWFLTGSNTEFNFSTSITEDITLYAHWEEVDTLTVTFNSNGGSSVSPQEVEYGEKATKPTNPTKTNQIFNYWSTDSDGNNEYDFTTPVTSDLELYAQWANVCTVTFQNGYCYRSRNSSTQCTFSLSTTSVDVACGTAVRRPEDPSSVTISNYTYYISKYATSQNPGYTTTTYDYDFSTVVNSNITLYAIGYNSYYTVTFNANGGTLVGPSSAIVGSYQGQQNKAYGFVREPDDPTRVGYTFKRWSTSNSTNGSEFNFNTTRIQSNTPLYALWTPITYTIKYNANGGVGNMSDTDMTYDTSANLRSNTFTKSNASFSGWNTKADGTGTGYTNGQSVTNLTTTSGDVITLYALWNCDSGYHDEGDGICVSDTKDVACIQSGAPANAHYITGDVTITWNGSSWPTADNCAWVCDTHYHTGANNNSCEIDTFQITWVDGDGHTLTTDTVNYGVTPTYNGATPTKTATAQYTYTWNNTWSPTLVPATANATYTAQFTETTRSYTATINVNNSSYGSVSPTSVTGNYNTNISTSNNTLTIGTTTVTANPATNTDDYTYEFSGWNNTCGNTLTDDCTITAEFRRLNNYTVTFDANRGTIVSPQRVAHGDTATQPSVEFPGYTFGGWYTDSELTNAFNFSTPITSDITLYAKWTYSLAFNDLNVYFVESDGSVEHSILMDRNLGATSAGTGSNSYGYYYQWGNNYGFPTAGTISNTTTTVSYNEWSQYIPSKYARSSWSTTNNWMNGSSTNDNIWGGNGNVTDRQGPCPDGYHVPNTNEWDNISNYWNSANRVTSNKSIQWASDLFLPLAGYRNVNRSIASQGEEGRYWSTSPNVSSAGLANYIRFYTPNYIEAKNYIYRSEGHSLRCFKNTQTQTMTVYPKGGTGAIVAFTGSVNNGKIVTLSSPTKANATFQGWYSDSTYNTQIITGSTAPANLYAKWQCNTGYEEVNDVCVLQSFGITITVTPEGYGTVSSGSVTANYGSIISISGNTVTIGTKTVTATATGRTQQYTYTFTGWINNCGDTLTGTCTIIAQFDRTVNQYDVTFDSNGGNYTPAVQTLDYGSTATQPTDPSKTGYDFGGWTLNGSDFNFSTPITEDITLLASWDAIDYTITYMDGEDEISGLTPSTYTIEDNVTLPTPEKAGYTFNGWLESGNAISSITAGTYGNKTLTATWTEREDTLYTVNYYVHNLGATTYSLNSTRQLSGRTNSTVQVSDLIKFITGHTYEAAYITGGTTKPTDGAVTSTTILPDGSRVINLYYRPNYLYTKLHMNGGTLSELHGTNYGMSGDWATYKGSTEILRGVYGSKVGIVSTGTYAVSSGGPLDYNNEQYLNVIRTGYTAKSGGEWNTQADGNGTSYSQTNGTYNAQGFAGADMTSGDAVVILYINWKPNTYNISYELNGGTHGATHPTTATYDTSFTVTNPTRAGYTFAGWQITGMDAGVVHTYGGNTTTDTSIASTKATSFMNLHSTKNATVTFIAQWTPNIDTKYYVEHWLQTLDLSDFDLIETDELSGTTDTLTNAQVHNYTGFTLDGNIADYQTTIGPNGDTVVQLYYYRNKYTVIWKNNNGTTLETDTNVRYWATPSYDGATPTSGANVQYTYTFAGWNPTVSPVTGNITYTATYNAIVNKYLITFKNRDGSVLQTGMVDYGVTPSYSGTPTKPSTQQYTYTFAGWSPAVSSVTQAQVYTATYSSTVNQYTATIVSNNTNYGTVSSGSVTADWGKTISTSNNTLTIGTTTVTATPTTATDDYTYEFSGWNNTCGNTLTGNCTITAEFRRLNNYTVTFDANRGTIVPSQRVAHGYTVTQPSVEFPGYTFGGWYSDSGLTNSFNFSTPITSDITLYAKWTYSLAFNDLNVYFVESDGSVNYNVIMDRNLGATATYNQNYSSPNTASYGYYYQWGNNYGFPNSLTIPTSSTQVDASDYGPGNYYNSSIFITRETSPYDWSSVRNDNLWGGNGSVTDRQGPCPDGYHVPTNTEYQSLYNYWNSANTVTTNKGRQWASDLLMPFAGDRGYSSSSVGNVGSYGYYWSSTAFSAVIAYILRFNSSSLTPQNGSSRASGFSVRCYKDSPSSTLTLYPKGGTGAVIVFTGSVNNGKIVTLSSPTKANATFKGWYSDSTYSNQIVTGSTAPANLYAKWQCNEHYHAEGDVCVIDSFDVTITPTPTGYGTVSSGSVKADYGTAISTNGNELTIGEKTITATPTSATQQYTYTFSGWNNTCGDTLTDDCMITAEFNRTVNQYTATINVNPAGYGTVTSGSVKKDYGTAISTNDDTLTIGTTTVTASPAADTDEWDYEFVNWSNNCGNQLTDNCTITANFTRTRKVYTVTITVDPTGQGSVTSGSVAADYGTLISINGNVLTIGEKNITANAATATQQYTYTFSGWVNNCGDAVQGQCTIVAEFIKTVNQYNVTFDSDGGNYTPAVQTLDYGSTATQPTAPTKTGYTFGNWLLSGATFNFSTPITGDITLVAKWDVITYNIIYKDGDETLSGLSPSTYTIEDNITTLPTPEKAGYAFSGWLENGNPISSISAGTYGNKTLTATWTERDDTLYTVNYYTHNLGATTYSLNSTRQLSGRTNSTIQVSDLVKFITGYTFEDAYTAGGTTKPTDGAITNTTILADGTRVINLYYYPNGLYIKHNVNGGVMAATHGANFGISGDYVTAEGKIEYIRGFYGSVVGNVTNSSTYTVTNGGVLDYNNSTYLNLVRTGYTAPTGQEWNTQADGNGTSYSQASNTNYRAQGFAGADMTNGDAVVTLYVNWKPNTYNISYELDGGTHGASHPTTATYDSGFTVSNPTRDGYTFDGWNITGMDGVTHTYGTDTTTATSIASTKATSFMNLHSTASATVTFTALWTPIEYTITYNTNGGINNSNNPSTYTIESDAITLQDPTKTGYTFLGWTGSNGSTAQISVVIAQGSTGNKTYNAVWSLDIYTIIYNLNGGKNNANNPSTYTVESNTITIQQPTRTGYTFLGWTGSNGTTAQMSVSIPHGSTGNRTYNATWEAKKVRFEVYHFYQNVDANNNVVLDTYYTNGVDDEDEVADKEITVADYIYLLSGFTYNHGEVNGQTVTTTTVDPDGSLVINLYYNRNKYNYTLNSATGATTAGSSVSGEYYYGAKVTLSGDINDNCYVWSGWSTSGVTLSSPASKKTSFTMPANDVTLTPVVNEKSYNIAFNGNQNTSGSMANINGVMCTESVQLPANGFGRAGYTFSGWATSAGGAKVYNNQQTVSRLSTTSGATVTLYAVWDANKNTPYVVNHWYLDLDDQRDTTNKVTENLSGTTDTTVTPAFISKTGFNNPTAQITTGIKGDGTTVINYEYPRKVVTLTFDANQGTPSSVKTGKYEANVGAVTEPTRTGYTFGGWSPSVPSTFPYEDRTYVAQWNIVTYDIIYTMNGGDNNPSNPSTYTIETPTFTITGATRTGYTFLGWTGSNGTTPQKTIELTKGNYGNKHYYANWSLNTYTITYNMNGGTNNVSNPSSYTVESNTITLQNPTKTGYIFDGWTGSNGTDPQEGVQIEHGSIGNKTYNAVWHLDTYGIFYELGGGTNNQSNPSTYTYESNTITLGDPTKTGYTFLGWTGANGNNLQKGVQILNHSTGNKTYYANWSANTYNILYTLNGGSYGTNHPTTATYDTLFTVNNPTKTGYTFSGWKITGMDGVTHTYGSNTTNSDTINRTKEIRFMNLHSTSGDTVTFTALWDANTNTQYLVYHNKEKLDGTYETVEVYTGHGASDTDVTPEVRTYVGFDSPAAQTVNINADGSRVVVYEYNRKVVTLTFDANGGTPSSVKTGKYEANVGAVTEPSRNGYAFEGWSPSVPSIFPAASGTYVAQWNIITYNIIYNLDDGDNNPSNPSSYTVESGNIQLQQPTKTGYTFKGWTGSNGSVPQTSVNIPHGSTGHKTYNAVWEANTYYISYELGGGSYGANHPNTATYNTSFTVNNPTRTGYTFSGWKITGMDGVTHTYGSNTTTATSIANTKEITFKNLHSTSGATVTFTALWDIVTYEIEYTMNGGKNDPSNPSSYTIETSTFTITGATRTGYTFLGWTGSNGTVPQQTIELTKGNYGAKHYYANWSLNTYTITYNMNGGENNVSNPSTYTYESGAITLQDPTRTGYLFSGWIGEGISTPTKGVQIPMHSVGNKEYTAIWDLDTYGIFYELDGGTNNQSNPSTYTYESNTITLGDPTKTGYTFLGWTGEGVTSPTKGIQISAHSVGNKTYYANWSLNTYTITYNMNNGVNNPSNPSTYTYESETITLQDPSRTGYTFIGWTGSNGETPEKGVQILHNSTENRTYNANWTANTNTQYVVYYEWEELSGGYVVHETYTGHGTTDMNVTPTVRSYTGFLSPSSQTVKIEPDGSTVVEYKYDRKVVTLTFDANQGTPGSTKTGKYGDNVGTVTEPSRNGYDFAGWSPAKPDTFPAASGTYVAQWDIVTYDIEYTMNGGKNNPSNPSSYTVETPTFTITGATRTGYTFLGWTGSNGTTPQKTIELTQGNYGNKHYYAVWTANVYNITYTLNTGAYGTNHPTTVIYDTQFTVNNPTRTGYTFSGWKITGMDVGVIHTYGESTTTATSIASTKETVFKNLNSVSGVTVNFEALWTANTGTEYTVKHRGENTGGTAYNVLLSGYLMYGTSDTQTIAESKEFSGFTLSGSVVQKKIEPDGSTVINIYYSRNEYSITFDSNGGTAVSTITGKYESAVTRPADPRRTGYTFAGWQPEVPSTMPLDGTSVTAQWTANTGTKYEVKHRGENVAGTAYDVLLTGYLMYGTSDTQTVAESRTFNGFTLSGGVVQKNIEPDGSTVIDIYYSRNEYSITFDSNEGTPVATITGKYESAVTPPADPTRTGYTFAGWQPEVPSTMPLNGTSVTAQWTANTGTEYYVYHYQENIAGGGYELVETEILSGTTDTLVTPNTKTYEGFTSPDGVEINIDPEGNASVSYYYTRNSYDIIYNVDGGIPVDNQTVRFEDTPEERVTTKTGYTFKGWSDLPSIMPAHDVNVTALWDANTGTQYKVIHIYTGTNDGLSGEVIEITWHGTSDSLVTGALAPKDGFINPEESQIYINSDGSASMTYVYERREYTLSYNENGGTPVESTLIKYGALTDKSPRPTRTGYQFVEWSGADRMPLNGTTLTAVWTPNTGTEYHVEHYKQNIDGTYPTSPSEVDVLYGTSDVQIEPGVNAYTGFTSPSKQTVIINPDGSLVVRYEYTRNSYDVTYDENGGVPVSGVSVKFEDTIPTLSTTRTGYQFSGWQGVPEDGKMPATGLNLVAEWTANTGTTYYVYHYQENIAGTGYDLIEVEELSGTTDTSVTPNTKTYEGFTSPSGIEINIDPDGNAIVRYYYTRNSYNLKIKDRDEVLVDKDVKYGDDIVLPADPIWTGHTFIRWSNVPADGKMPANALDIVAIWDVNSYTITFDTDGGSELAPITGNYGDPIIPPATPTKDGYRFVGWDPEIPETMPNHDMTIKAIWEKINENKRSGGGGHGGGSSDEHGSADDQQPQGGTGSDMSYVDPEVLAAYQWAYAHGITTIEGLENANPDGLIPRGHMAKMVTNFAVNVLGREIPEEIPAECSWGDTDWESEEIKDYAVKSCALGVMGIYMEDFLPNKILDRAELGTIISRLLWGDKYNVIDTNNRPYYVEHLKELKNEGIMTQIQNPEARKELRKWAWVMLMRVQQ